MSIRRKVSEEVLAADETAIQSTFVYQCLLIDGIEREYDALVLRVNRLLDLLGVPDGSIRDRLALAQRSYHETRNSDRGQL